MTSAGRCVASFILCLCALGSLRVSAEPASDEHLRKGARAFREGEFERALVEFRVAQKLGADPEVHWYIGAALVKLQRPEEAVEAFGVLAELEPTRRDPLLDYYRAVACHGARLYVCAAALLDAVVESGGPAVTGQASALKQKLLGVLTAAPDTQTVDWYHQRAAQADSEGRPHLSRAYLSEAVVLGRRRADGYRVIEAEQKLSRGKVPPG